ncbi:MAG: thermonuclease family protein [Elusimicrobia bacterium]|nr:thermonuclease family protein [Elusimicrobiota bacterium]
MGSKLRILLASLAFALVSKPVQAHGGGRDKLGCHHDRKAGGYHCHKGPLDGRLFKSKEDALEALGTSQESPPPPKQKILPGYYTMETDEKTKVRRVVDGDTLVLEDGRKVRLIGVDTPELHHPKKPVQYYAKEAKDFVEALVEGKAVNLALDPDNTYVKHKDKYGRLLAYVLLPDGDILNAKIIREGYGFAYTRFPYKLMDNFRALEKEARENKRGLWK